MIFNDRKAEYRKSFEASFGCKYNDASSMLEAICDPDCFMKVFGDYRIGDYYIEGLISHIHSGKYDSDDSPFDRDTERFREVIIYNVGMQCLDSKMTEIILQDEMRQARAMPLEKISC